LDRLISENEALEMKLNTITVPLLKELAKEFDKKSLYKLNKSGIIKFIIENNITHTKLNKFIKKKYNNKLKERIKIISDEELSNELHKVKTFHWGAVQGKLDKLIQKNYVREYSKYSELIDSIEKKLYETIKNYAICTWYNHWTTIIIEDCISEHHRVVPTITHQTKIDIFFDNQPFDLKTTYFPKFYKKSIEDALKNPKDLIVQLYEKQGDNYRFGYDNRLYVVLLDSKNPERSWEMKRDFKLIQKRIMEFFDNEKVTENDKIKFKFKKKFYEAISKILFIVK